MDQVLKKQWGQVLNISLPNRHPYIHKTLMRAYCHTPQPQKAAKRVLARCYKYGCSLKNIVEKTTM